MNEDQQLVTIEENTPLADSREIARKLNMTPKNFRELLQDKQHFIEKHFGVLRFLSAKPLPGSAGGRPEKYAMLTEEQSYYALTFCENTDAAMELRALLIKAFMEARAKLQMLEAHVNVQMFPAQVLRAHQALAEWVTLVKEEGEHNEITDLLFETWRQECARITPEEQATWNDTITTLLTQQRPLLAS